MARSAQEVMKSDFSAAHPALVDGQKAKSASTARFGVPGQNIHVWEYNLPEDHEWEDMLTPNYWRAMALKLRVGDEIKVQNDRLSMWGFLKVVSSSPHAGFAQVQTLIKVDLKPIDHEGFSEDGFSAEWTGIHSGYSIKRDKDGHVMHTGLKTKEAAREYLRNLQSRQVGAR